MKLSEIVAQIERALIPAWVKDHIYQNKDAIAAALRDKGVYVIPGPNGQSIEIKADRQRRPRGGRSLGRLFTKRTA